jgi:hypothetical protein
MVLRIFFLFFFDFFEKFLVLFELFENGKRKNNVGSFDFFRCVAPAAKKNSRKNQHFFAFSIFKNVQKE